MAINRLPPSVNPSEESESEEEEDPSVNPSEESESEEEEDDGVEEQVVVADEVNRKESGSEEEDLSAKTTSQVRGLDYGSSVDSGKTISSQSVSDFVVKRNSKIEKDKEPKKKRLAETDESRDKSQVKKPKREKKKVNGAEKDVKWEVKSVSREDDSASRAKMDLGGTDFETKDFIIPMPATAMEEDSFIVKRGMELVDKWKVDALNDKWTKYQLELAQLHAKKLDLVMERTKLILDALKSNP